MKRINQNKIGLILFHIALGPFALRISNNITAVFFVLLFVYSIYKTFTTRNRNQIGLIYISYFTGLELFLRITKTGFLWEFGKYTVILLTLTCLATEPRVKRKGKIYFLYVLLLIPSVLMVDTSRSTESWREMIAAGLAGPFVLGLTGLYLYQKPIYKETWVKIMQALLLPLTSCLFIMIFNYLNLTHVNFNMHSNFTMTAGFGPNQVSTVLGFAVVAIVLVNLWGDYFTTHLAIDWILGALFIVFALLTFSRGGVISAGISVFCTVFYIYISNKDRRKFKNAKIVFFFILLASYQVWDYANKISSGALKERYILTKSMEDKSAFTGRKNLANMDYQMFLDNPIFGIGPGMTKHVRREYGLKSYQAAHTEYTRLLAEHGIFGLADLVVLFFIPLSYFFHNRRPPDRLKFISLISVSLLTMGHSAMRLALPGFIYALAMAQFLTPDDDQYKSA